jgi:hypothetical protein
MVGNSFLKFFYFGLFKGSASSPGSQLTRAGARAFLSQLFETERVHGFFS